MGTQDTRTVRIIGLDPGLRHTGWGIITVKGSYISYHAHGVISPPDKDSIGDRLSSLFMHLTQVIETYQPTEAAIEETFVNQNPRSTLKLGMARGIVFLTPARFGIPVEEYAPNQIKKTIVGVGHAQKKQISLMVQRLLPGCGQVDQDAADALAIALCHAHFRQTHQLWKGAS